VEERRRRVPLEALKERIAGMPPVRDFAAALRRSPGEPVNLLAEIKAASPSEGAIRPEFDAAQVARLYERCGAAAVSVLTETKYFAGTDEHLQQARGAISRPVLRKDFTLEEYQLYESRAIGADAVLLMAQVLDPGYYEELFRMASELGLQVLAEGHTPRQIEFLVRLGAPVIGINNRDFDTMRVDLQTTLQQRALVPPRHVLVSQSGISRRAEVQQLEAIGVDAIQVGTSLMRNSDMQAQFRHLLGK
jgi:indole-3-glycerol phosphate synthase